MTEEEMFNNWWHKHYEPADIQIDDLISGGENIYMPASVYKDDIKVAYLQGYKDANKWHFVKDELPLIGRPCVCIDFEHNIGIAYLREDNVWTTNGKNAFETVKLWQYIELPEPPKEI